VVTEQGEDLAVRGPQHPRKDATSLGSVDDENAGVGSPNDVGRDETAADMGFCNMSFAPTAGKRRQDRA
jgi:hypothetical protein